MSKRQDQGRDLDAGPLLGPKVPDAALGADAGALAGAAGAAALRVLVAAGRLGAGVWADAGRFQAIAVVMTTAAAVRASGLLMSGFLSVG